MNRKPQDQITVQDEPQTIAANNRVKPVAVKALADFRLWVRYADGAEGVVDLSDLARRRAF